MNTQKESLLLELWAAQDEAYDLMEEYDGIPHCYGDEVMYHTEGQIIDLIAEHPGITCAGIAEITKKTPSACSQVVKKLKNRGFIQQTRNEKNNRKYNLVLTAKGLQICKERRVFTQNCQEIMWEMLSEFTEKELECHVKVQKQINESYRGDIQRSREHFKIKK